MKTQERYQWRFDDIPPSYLSSKYYDEVVQADFVGAADPRQTAIMNFPPIDSRAIIYKWGVSICTDSGGNDHYEENIYDILFRVLISLRINNSAVPGYGGKTFPPISWQHFDNAASNHVMMIMNPAWLCDLTFPIFENSTPLQITVTDMTMVSIVNFYCFGRIIGRYID